MKIVIGIPTLNRYDLLKENLADLQTNMSDHDGLIIVDNGNQNIQPTPLISAIHNPGKNLGVSASWNYILSTSFGETYDADYCVILNDDIVLGKTKQQLTDLIISNNNPEFLIGPYFWSAFIMAKSCFASVGLFDEKFYPAYYEDNDYYYRMVLNGTRYVFTDVLDPAIKRNSMTIKKNKNINYNFSNNKNYFIKKWGGEPGKEKYPTPFNK